MNDLLNIEVLNKETKEKFTLTGFHSKGGGGNSKKPLPAEVTEIGLKDKNGHCFQVSRKQFNQYVLSPNQIIFPL